MRTAVIPAEEQQRDQTLFIGNEFSAVNHPENLLLGGPANGLHFLILQMKRLQVNFPGQNIIIVETVFPVDGQARTDIRQVKGQPQLLPCFPLRSGPAAVSSAWIAGRLTSLSTGT